MGHDFSSLEKVKDVQGSKDDWEGGFWHRDDDGMYDEEDLAEKNESRSHEKGFLVVV